MSQRMLVKWCDRVSNYLVTYVPSDEGSESSVQALLGTQGCGKGVRVSSVVIDIPNKLILQSPRIQPDVQPEACILYCRQRSCRCQDNIFVKLHLLYDLVTFRR